MSKIVLRHRLLFLVSGVVYIFCIFTGFYLSGMVYKVHFYFESLKIKGDTMCQLEILTLNS